MVRECDNRYLIPCDVDNLADPYVCLYLGLGLGLDWHDRWMWWCASRNLIPCDADNLADPYVRLYLGPDHSSSNKRKTQTHKNSLSPVYDETLVKFLSTGVMFPYAALWRQIFWSDHGPTGR